MHNRLLKVILATLIACTMCCGAYAAATKAATTKPAAKMDQKAMLMKMWAAPDSTVVGSVNGVSVTKGELVKSLWLWNAPNQLQDLLTQKMIEQAAAKAGVKISDKEIQDKVKESLKRSNMTNVDDLLGQYRITWYRFMDANKVNGLAEKTVQKSLKVTDAELAEWIKARHILIRFPQDEKDQAKKEEVAKKKIDEIEAKLKAGEDFSKLADEYTEDPSNSQEGQKKGGDLGWFTKGRMVADFENEAFKLKVGGVSAPVKTFYGYHLIKVDALGKDATPAAKLELKKMILEQKMTAETSKWYSDLMEKSKMDNKLAGPAPKMPKPEVRPQAPPRPRSQPSEKPADPQSSEKPATPPPPPPPSE